LQQQQADDRELADQKELEYLQMQSELDFFKAQANSSGRTQSSLPGFQFQIPKPMGPNQLFQLARPDNSSAPRENNNDYLFGQPASGQF
jgi:hypothetical protein